MTFASSSSIHLTPKWSHEYLNTLPRLWRSRTLSFVSFAPVALYAQESISTHVFPTRPFPQRRTFRPHPPHLLYLFFKLHIAFIQLSTYTTWLRLERLGKCRYHLLLVRSFGPTPRLYHPQQIPQRNIARHTEFGIPSAVTPTPPPTSSKTNSNPAPKIPSAIRLMIQTPRG